MTYAYLIFFVIFIIIIAIISKKKYGNTICWWIYHYLGLRFLLKKFHPEKNGEINKSKYRKPSSFMVWVYGLYITLFGIAYQIYSTEYSRLNSEFNAIKFERQLINEGMSDAGIVQRIKIPQKPSFINPVSVFNSLFTRELNTKMLKKLKKKVKRRLKTNDIENKKTENLEFLNLNGVDLSDIYFRKNRMYAINLEETNLSGCWFDNCNLDMSAINPCVESKVTFNGGSFINSRVTIKGEFTFDDVNLKQAYIEVDSKSKAIFENSNLNSVRFLRTDFNNVSFSNVNICEIDFTYRLANRKVYENFNLAQASFNDAYYLDYPEFNDYLKKNKNEYSSHEYVNENGELDYCYDGTCNDCIKAKKDKRYNKIKELLKPVVIKKGSSDYLFFYNIKETIFPSCFNPEEHNGLINIFDYYKEKKQLPEIIIKFIKQSDVYKKIKRI